MNRIEGRDSFEAQCANLGQLAGSLKEQSKSNSHITPSEQQAAQQKFGAVQREMNELASSIREQTLEESKRPR